MAKKKKVVVIGGGTGTFTILSGLKKYPNLDLSVIVSMMDDGGSNRVIRDEFGLLPTSDIRQCIVALSSDDSDLTLRKLFTYRYESGVGISGMTFGNLFMAALTDIYKGNQKKAIEETCEILGVKGSIVPVTLEKTNLSATYENGKQVLGEHDIDEPNKNIGKYKIVKLEVIPKVKVNMDAIKKIYEADLVILGPGDFYTSILPNLVIEGVPKAIQKTKSKVVFVLNLMTKFGQTQNFKASDFVSEMEKYLGKNSLDFIISNKTRSFSKHILKLYQKEDAHPVEDDLNDKNYFFKVIRRDLVSDKIYEKPKSDAMARSLVRHDQTKLARAVVSLLNKP